MELPSPSQASRLELFPTANLRSSASGQALIIVLAMLTLMSILIVAFLSSVSTELRSAKSYAVGYDARALTDAAVNVVISQLQDATSAPTNAWASQPGMIRTYNAAGTPVTSYKLYSSSQLQVSGAFNAVTQVSTEVPSTWASSPDQYTDLNSPVIVTESTNSVYHYPIISPSAVATSQSTGPLGTSVAAMDGTADASPAPIQGCYIDQSNPDASICTIPATLTPTVNPVPMPVQWMYVLQDGTFASMSSAGTITTSTGGSPTTANPIVGRIAFWTDDESCKVNINTSGEGTFSDRPYTDSTSSGANTYSGYEQNFLGYTVPAQNEFQRYPGHPAMTCLSVIFPALSGETVPAYNERVYGIIPRLATGGSVSGTVQVVAGSTGPPVVVATPTPVPNAYRLFDSVDEFLFSAVATNPRPVNLKGPSTNFTETDIEKARFFLTANSTAPEVNMFNKPRIALWPIQVNTAARTALDQQIAFCSTVGGATTNPLLYYFQRYTTFDPTQVRTSSQTYPASITQSPIPSSQSPTLDWSQIPRNQSLFQYLQYLTSNSIPGIGGSLSGTGSGAKYSQSVCNQILTEMMDFIRSEVTTASTGTTPSYYYAPGQSSGTLVTGERQVVPLVITPPSASGYTTKGFGRFETIQQAALVFYRTDKATITGSALAGYTITQNPPTASISAATPAHIGVVLLLNPFNPTPGSRSWCPNVRYVVSGLSGCKINSVALTTPFPDPGTLLLTGINNTVNATALMGPEFFFRYNNILTALGGSEAGPKTLGPTTVGSATEEQNYPFYATATLSAVLGGTSFRFTPPTTPITIQVYQGYATALNPGDLVQTISMTFPQANLNLPVPTVSMSQSGSSGTYTETDGNSFTDFNARIGANNGYPEQGIDNDSPSPQHNPSPFITSGDTVRSIEARYKGPAMGDLRIFSALPSVPQDYFDSYATAHDTPSSDDAGAANGYDSSTALVHSLRMFNNPNGTGNNFGAYSGCIGPQGLLIAGATSYYQVAAGKHSAYPIVPRGLTATQVQLTGLDGALHPGDWDTGPGDQPDGPYINKPDESNSGYMGQYTMGSSQYTAQIPEEQGNTYSPNRQICSAVAFGSLPTGVDPANPDLVGTGAQTNGGIRPWQTLLFCPNPAAGLQHPGFGTPVTSSSGTYPSGQQPQPPPYTIPPDSAFLDFFTMPVVEPYAISEPFSSAGKVNMNYQIVPFSYLTRDTAVRAVLKSTRMMAIPPSYATGTAATGCYKVPAAGGPPDFRYTISPDEVSGTLAGFQQRFTSGDIFRSATEICSLYLVPQYLVKCPTAGGGETVNTSSSAPGSPTYATMSTWWSNYTLTGDNVREDPYNQIYPRLTTKSNTFTIHFRVQTLKKAINTAANVFVDGQDQVTSEYRGSSIVQRYLDPNSDTLYNPLTGAVGTETDPDSMVGPYKYRIVSTKRFAP